MKTDLYQHQKGLIAENPLKQGIAFGCGMGKTRTAIFLAENKGTVLIVAPKTTIETKTWENEISEIGSPLKPTIMSKERFKKGAPGSDVLVLDEAHCFLGVRPETRYRNKVEIPKASQLFEDVMQWIETYKPKAIYLCSATPIPGPMAVWAAMAFMGINPDYFAFRRRFFTFLPHIRRGVWIPKTDATSESALMNLAAIVWKFKKREDAKDMPALVFKTIDTGISSTQNKALRDIKISYPDPITRIGKMHQIEQGGVDGEAFDEYKTSEVEELAKEFPKVLVFAKYTAQIDDMASKLKGRFPKRDILILDGRTKDRKSLLEKAEDQKRQTIVIAQSQVSSSYNLPSFRCMVFASMSYSLVDYEQALGRNQRGEHLVPSVYVHLIAGDIDKAVHKCLLHKRDFNELLFLQK